MLPSARLTGRMALRQIAPQHKTNKQPTNMRRKIGASIGQAEDQVEAQKNRRGPGHLRHGQLGNLSAFD
jgi:hypothetical protein